MKLVPTARPNVAESAGRRWPRTAGRHPPSWQPPRGLAWPDLRESGAGPTHKPARPLPGCAAASAAMPS